MSFFRRIFGKPEDEEMVDGASVQSDDNLDNAKTQPLAPEVVDNAVVVDDVTEPKKVDAAIEQARTGPVTKPIPDGVTRPLPAEPTYQTHKGHAIVGQSSDPGMVRSNNQDAAISFFLSSDTADEQPDFGLLIVADGMGGHHDGEKASAVTAKTVAAQVMEMLYLPLLQDENDSNRPTIAEALATAAKQANQLVLKKVPEGGTTLTTVVIIGDLAHIVHVGDSRAYLITEDGIEQITRDHSLVQRLIELGQLSPEEAAEHPQRNVLYRAIGQNDTLEVDTLTRRLPSGSSVLVCSDGLWGLVEDDVLATTIQEAASPQQACEQLVAMANANGGHDNITAVIAQIPAN